MAYRCLIFVAGLILLVQSGCVSRQVEPFDYDCSEQVSFEEDVAPIFQNSCYVGGGEIGCHSAWVYSWEGIDSYDYFGTIEQLVLKEYSMPPLTNEFGIERLTFEELQIIHCWYEQGALNN